MKHILFVDDEPNLLSGLRRMLRPMKAEWDMDFADSGENALQLLGAKSYDVIVSDIRMPGMNGVQLLRKVMQDYPSTVRIAFSGEAGKEMMLDVAGAAHQYLAKPCDAEQVKQTVNRTCDLRRVLANDDLRKLVSGLSTIPSLPELYQQIVEKAESPDASLRDVGDIISQDIGMTAKILQLVNSAFFGLKQHVSTPGDAAALLGIEVVKGLVLTTKLFSELEQGIASALDISRLWQLSIETGALAQQIAVTEIQDAKTKDYALMAGMLHGVGQIVLAVNMPEKYARLNAEANSSARAIWCLEVEEFGCNHMEVGAYLLGLWGLAAPIVEAVAYYPRPMQSQNSEFSPLTAVHAARALILGEYEDPDQAQFLDQEYLANVGIADHVQHWRDLLLKMHNVTGEEK